MKPRANRITMLTTLAFLVVCPSGLAAAGQSEDDTAIDTYIARQAQRERGEEYREARKSVAGDLTRDSVPETVVLYTIEGQSGTNRHGQYLAVFARRDGKLTPLTNAAIGSKTVGDVELKSVENETILLDTLSYGPKDAQCCPSVHGTARYVLAGGMLHEQKQVASKGRHN